MSIFARYAPFYHAKKMSVIPLHVNSKRPLTTAWSDFSEYLVPDDIHQQWMSLPADHNIGLVLGRQSNVGALDIDYADQDLIDAILEMLPAGYDKWKRIGAKGMVLAFRFNPKVPRAFKIIDKQKGTLVEYLCTGQQIVLPPSIHPDTKQPYTSNSDLWEIVDDLPMIPDDLEERIRNLCVLKGYEISNKGVGSLVEHIPAGFRDSSITQKNGLLAHQVVEGKITIRQAIDHLHAINDGFTEQVEGDPMDMDKHTRNLIKFIHQTMQKRKIALPAGWAEGLSDKEIAQLGLSEVNEEWSYERILSYYDLEADNVKEENALSLVDDVLFRLAQIKKPDAVRESWCINKIVEKSGLPIKPSDLKAKLRQMREEAQKTTAIGGDEDGNGATEITLNTHTEVATAVIDLMSTLHPVKVDNGTLYKFMGSHWVALEPTELKQFIAVNFANLDIMKRNSDIDGVYKQVLILCEQGLIDNQDAYVNVANGMVVENPAAKLVNDNHSMEKEEDRLRQSILSHPSAQMGLWSDAEIKSAQDNLVKKFRESSVSPLSFVPHSGEYGSTYVLPYRYLPELAGKMPLFDKFLHDSWGHNDDYQQRRDALQEALYVSFMGRATKYQRAFLLYGLAQSGKSVLLEIIGSLFPDEAKASVSFDKMSENRMVVSLHRKNLNIVGELSERKYIEGDVFKSVIDGSPRSVYQLYKESFMMRPTAAHWAASNHLPKTADTSEGFTRRWLFFHFDQQVAADKIDVDLAKKIISQEREAIFAWALEAGSRLSRSQGFTLPTSHKRLIATLSFQTNPALFFLMKDPSLEIKKFAHPTKQHEVFEATELDLHLQFRQFMRLGIGSRRVIEMQEFRHMLDEIIKARGIERFSKEGDINQWYRGIRVKSNLKM